MIVSKQFSFHIQTQTQERRKHETVQENRKQEEKYLYKQQKKAKQNRLVIVHLNR